MLTSVMKCEIFLPDARSLKDKRQVRSSLLQRMKARNISAVEAEKADVHKQLVLLLSFVSLSEREAKEKWEGILDLIYEFSEHVHVEEEIFYLE